jgi:hypothetical protein
MQIVGAMAILIMAGTGMCWIYVEGREDETKLTTINARVFLLIYAVALGVSAWAFMSEAT